MNLGATIELVYSGGPGSGCNPEVGKCGRPASGLNSPEEFFQEWVDQGHHMWEIQHTAAEAFEQNKGKDLHVEDFHSQVPNAYNEDTTKIQRRYSEGT